MKWQAAVLDDFLVRATSSTVSVLTRDRPAARSLRFALYKRRKTTPFSGEIRVSGKTVWLVPQEELIIHAEQKKDF